MNKSLNALIRTIGFWGGALAILAAILLGIGVPVSVFLNPLPFARTALDAKWAIFFGGAFALCGATFWIAKGRFLLAAALAALAGFLGAAAILAGLGWALLITFGLLFASVAAGDYLLKRTALLDELHLSERLALDIALGMGLFMALGLLMGAVGLYYRWTAYTLLLLVSLIALTDTQRPLWPLVRAQVLAVYERYRDADLRWPALVLAILLILLLGAALWSLTPSIRYDALTYHLAAADIYIQNHAMLEIPEAPYASWAHYAEMLYTFGLLLYGQPLPGLLHLSAGMISTLLTFTLGRRILGMRAGILAAFLFISTPLVSYEIGTAYIDFFISLFTTAMILSGLIAWQSRQMRWWVVAGIFGGLAVGTKLSAAPVVLALAFLILAGESGRSKTLRAVRPVAAFGLTALLFALPWLIRDGLWTGDPIFPFSSMLLSYFFPGPAAAPAPGLAARPNMLLRLLSYPWVLTVNSARYYHESPGGILGALPLLGLPWLYLGTRQLSMNTRRMLGGLFCLILLSAALIYVTSAGLARYLSPLYPLIAIAAAANLEVIIRQASGKTHARVLLAAGLTLALVYLFATRLAVIVRTMDFEERFPLRYWLGMESQEAFLSKGLPVYPVFQYLDRQGGRHNVLSIGNEFRLYTHATIDGAWGAPDTHQMLAGATDAADLAAKMAAKGYDYLLIDAPTAAYLPQKYDFPVVDGVFLNRFTRLETVNQGIYLYRFYPDEAPQEQAENLLQNNSFERIDPEGCPKDWLCEGKVRPAGAEKARSGKASITLRGPIPQEGYGYVFQKRTIRANQIYTAGYWVLSETPVTIQLQIYWLDEAGGLIDTSMEWKTSQPGWGWVQMSAVAPNEARGAEIYASLSNQGQAWFDDLCFAAGQRCP